MKQSDIDILRAAFDKHTVERNGHIIWTDPSGRVCLGGRNIYKRMVSMIVHGQYIEGLRPQQNKEVCKVNNCVHPDHIEQVNYKRGERRDTSFIPYECDALSREIMCRPWGKRRSVRSHWL